MPNHIQADEKQYQEDDSGIKDESAFPRLEVLAQISNMIYIHSVAIFHKTVNREYKRDGENYPG